MSNRQRPPYQQANAPAPRQNEYFVPRDGIDREVITADICRYLGNDALVRPGTHPDDNGRIIQGYFITAYRNLTSAMIADLKNDSARWDAERRKHQSGAVRYQDSHIRDGPQRGPGGGGGGSYGLQSGYGGNPRDYDSGPPRYPGSDTPGYSGSGHGGPNPYGPPGGGAGVYGNNQFSQGPPPQAQYAPQPPAAPQDLGYGGHPAPMSGLVNNYGQPSAPLAPEGYSSGAHYAVSNNRGGYGMDMAMSDAPLAPARRNSPPSGPAAFGDPGPNTRGNYGNVPVGPTTGFGGYPPPASSNHNAAYIQPIDQKYGRAPNATNSGFSPAHELPPQPQQGPQQPLVPPPQQAQQYEDPAYPPSPSRATSVAASTQTQLSSNSGQSAGPRRDRERERDATPPNRTGSATKPTNPSHHHYNRR
ncbi:transcription factor [Niveomyces insectorum RCEF 264]|uniref:Transcription factor n=1 Tax=Niveomyces insectorum RCEF 264 TaxID=1081102 RepID=A0A167W4Y2_9HYPO|nr:transcription factor [Niveomyces insectorum RCEF 264]